MNLKPCAILLHEVRQDRVAMLGVLTTWRSNAERRRFGRSRQQLARLSRRLFRAVQHSDHRHAIRASLDFVGEGTVHVAEAQTAVDRAGPQQVVEFGLGKMRIAPEYRYTRLNRPGGNQSTLLVGFTF